MITVGYVRRGEKIAALCAELDGFYGNAPGDSSAELAAQVAMPCPVTGLLARGARRAPPARWRCRWMQNGQM
jgi:hypothetical protein